MQKIILTVVIVGLAGCSTGTSKRETYDLINAEMSRAVETKVTPAKPDAVAAALLPSIQMEMPQVRQPLEERFGVTFNNMPAPQFFMSIASGTPYSMLVHPDVSGTISANLKDVTIFEALDAVRELYGYDYKVEGTRIYIKPLTLQTRMYQVNYLTGSRNGTSDIRVTSGSVSDSTSGSGTGASGAGGPSGSSTQTLNSSKISTTSSSDFWRELKGSLEAIVGVGAGANKDGRSVVISPQSGVVLVRGMWDELRNVTAYLKATQLSVDRQVILEAKILEVQLKDSHQSGINWASFSSFSGNLTNHVATGFVAPGVTLSSPAYSNNLPLTATDSGINAITRLAIGAGATAPGSLFGLAFQTSNFAALLSFLETQGNVHVLSSPRIATLNNQKAVLKVGVDEFFVTRLTSTPSTTGAAGSIAPSTTTVDVQPFFSGVALDVTPQIDDSGNIILHIHPSVSEVKTADKTINLGNGQAFLSLPLASSSVSETDSVVRGRDGQVVAIGGLMRQSSSLDNSQVPVAGNIPVLGALFRNTSQAVQKRELVILLKPTIVEGNGNWTQDMLDSQRRIQALEPRSLPGLR